MKKITSTLIALIITFSLFSQEKDYSLARVSKQNGVYIFVQSKPIQPYDYIATIKVHVTWSGTISESFEKTIKKAKKKYTNFNGLIFHDENLNKADLILFKGLNVSVKGYVIGDNVSFTIKKTLYDGIIVKLNKKEADIKYDANGEEKIISLHYDEFNK